MSEYDVDNYEAALYNTAQRIIQKAVQIGENQPDAITDSVRTLLLKEAPEGMPLNWIMYIRDVAAALGEGTPGMDNESLMRRVGDAIVEVIDDGEVGDKNQL